MYSSKTGRRIPLSRKRIVFSIIFSFVSCQAASLADVGSPVPGMQPYGLLAPPAGQTRNYAPTPGSASPSPAPSAVVGAASPPAGQSLPSEYRRLPLNAPLAAARLEELRNLMPNTRPKEFQEALAEFCEWLSDMADAHWRMSQSFARHETTRAEAEAEKQACLKFGQIKRQAMLLKGEFLIASNRYPEAISPLIEIVVAEPRTETGINAYRLLKDIGFSQDPPAQAASGVPSGLAPKSLSSVVSEGAPSASCLQTNRSASLLPLRAPASGAAASCLTGASLSSASSKPLVRQTLPDGQAPASKGVAGVSRNSLPGQPKDLLSRPLSGTR